MGTSESEKPPTSASRGLRALRGATLAVGLILFGFFAAAVVQRFRFPIELEWMCGAVLDHVERVQRGEQLYVAPSAAFIPFIYPPLYYWVSAALAKGMSIIAACRVVSLTCTLATALLLYPISRRLLATEFWSLVAVAMFFAAYSLTGFWYDIERCDSLVTFLLVSSTLIPLIERRVVGAALGGAVVGLAFFAKQPALFVLAGGTFSFLILRQWWRGAAYGGVGLLAITAGTMALDRSSGGWFSRYIFEIPSHHGIRSKLITLFLVVDASQAFALFAATVGLAILAYRETIIPHRFGDDASGRLVFFTGCLLGAFGASAFSRWHVGGWPNVLMFWSTFACPALAAGASRLEAAARDSPFGGTISFITCGAVLLQLGRFAYTPDEPYPTASARYYAGAIEDTVRDLEKSAGEVILLGRGHVTEPRHLHMAALADVLRAGLDVPHDLADGLRERKYAAFIVDDFTELSLEPLLEGRRSELFGLVTANYFVARRLDERVPRPIVGWVAHPSWILRPRQKPLIDFGPTSLQRRQRIEMGVAEERMREVQAGARLADDGLDIEKVSEQIDLASTERALGPGELP
jgi:hypothetical protein